MDIVIKKTRVDLARNRNKIIDASSVGHSTRARALRLETAMMMTEAKLEEYFKDLDL